jgi:hypothetical protein
MSDQTNILQGIKNNLIPEPDHSPEILLDVVSLVLGFGSAGLFNGCEWGFNPSDSTCIELIHKSISYQTNFASDWKEKGR